MQTTSIQQRQCVLMTFITVSAACNAPQRQLVTEVSEQSPVSHDSTAAAGFLGSIACGLLLLPASGRWDLR